MDYEFVTISVMPECIAVLLYCISVPFLLLLHWHSTNNYNRFIDCHTHSHTFPPSHPHALTPSRPHSESLQGLGFTVIVDMRQTSWRVTKKVLKAIQLTFVEHVYQVLVVKPKAFWQRQKTGMTLTMKKLKYNFPVSPSLLPWVHVQTESSRTCVLL